MLSLFFDHILIILIFHVFIRRPCFISVWTNTFCELFNLGPISFEIFTDFKRRQRSSTNAPTPIPFRILGLVGHICAKTEETEALSFN